MIYLLGHKMSLVLNHCPTKAVGKHAVDYLERHILLSFWLLPSYIS